MPHASAAMSRDVPPLVTPQTFDASPPEAASDGAAGPRPARACPFAQARWVCVAPGRSAHARP